jgi:2,3-bisphosphoglycerate-independent phosphoglycerate mutase
VVSAPGSGAQVVRGRIAGRRAVGAVDVLVILDGASEPLGAAPTSLERARTPVLDGLAPESSVIRLRTVAPGLPAGSETAIPALLGWVPDGPVDRGAIEAAAHAIEIGDGERAWRVDRRDRADASATARTLARALSERVSRPRDACAYRVHHLAGHRVLVVGPDAVARDHVAGANHVPTLASELLVWPEGTILPRTLDQDTVVIGARGAAIGIGRLMGARTIVPPAATGRPGTDLAAKADAALAEIDAGAARVIVHVGAPDEAAHEHDAAAKVAAIEAADALLLAPLAAALRARRARLGAGAATLRVCPDHGCDPATGRHDGAAVPCLRWPFDRVPDLAVPDVALPDVAGPHLAVPAGYAPAGYLPYDRASGERLTERAVAQQSVTYLASVTPAGRRRPRERAVLA